MKKLSLIVTMFIFLFAIASFGKGGNGKVVTLKGKAYILTYHNGFKKSRLMPGNIIRPQDIILTTKTGIVKISLADKSTVVVKQNSRIQFSFVSKKSQRIRIGQGGLLSRVNKLRSKKGFSVTTPTSVAGVRGTKFVTEYNESNRENKIDVYEGHVDFSRDSVRKVRRVDNIDGKIVLGEERIISRHKVGLKKGKAISFRGSETTVRSADPKLLRKYEQLVEEAAENISGWEFN